MSLAAMSDVRMFRAVPAEAEGQVALYLALANEWAEGEIGCDLSTGTAVVERLSGDGTRILKPSRWPITDVDALAIESLDLTLTVMKNGDAEAYQDVWLPPHGFFLVMRETWESTQALASFPVGTANIKLTYDCGHSTIPADVRGAIAMLTHVLWSKRELIGRSALPSGQRDLSVMVKKLDEYPLIESTLRRYRRPYIG